MIFYVRKLIIQAGALYKKIDFTNIVFSEFAVSVVTLILLDFAGNMIAINIFYDFQKIRVGQACRITKLNYSSLKIRRPSGLILSMLCVVIREPVFLISVYWNAL